MVRSGTFFLVVLTRAINNEKLFGRLFWCQNKKDWNFISSCLTLHFSPATITRQRFFLSPERRILNVTFKMTEHLCCFSWWWTTVSRNSHGVLLVRYIHKHIVYIPWVMGHTGTSLVFARFREDEAVGVITSLVRRMRHGWCQCDSYLISIIALYAYQTPLPLLQALLTFTFPSYILNTNSRSSWSKFSLTKIGKTGILICSIIRVPIISNMHSDNLVALQRSIKCTLWPASRNKTHNMLCLFYTSLYCVYWLKNWFISDIMIFCSELFSHRFWFMHSDKYLFNPTKIQLGQPKNLLHTRLTELLFESTKK